MKDNYVLIDEVEISSSFNEIAVVEDLVDRVFNTHFTNTDSYGNMLIAVTEAVNNAIVHGNKQVKENKVRLEVVSDDAEVIFTVLDQGVGFDFNNLPDPTTPENIEKENGRGIFLMKSLSDGVEFDKGGREVHIHFTK